jgi:hypothetical protein
VRRRKGRPRNPSVVCLLALAGLVPHGLASFARAFDGAAELPQLVVWRACLLAPLATDFSRKGDMVAARVVEPEQFAGSLLEGDVREIRGGGTGTHIEFEFRKLHTGESSLEVTAGLLGVVNSRGQPGVDENGNRLESGARGQQWKLSPGVLQFRPGPPRLAVSAPEMSLAPGSQFTLLVKPRKTR